MTAIEMGQGRLKPSAPLLLAGVAPQALLACGIVSSLFYVVMNVVVPMQYAGYSVTAQTVSELSAIDAPTRALWIMLAIPYSLLLIGFGWGVRQSTAHVTRLRVVGGLLLAQGVIGLAWPPMHQREVLAAGGGTLTDTMHIVYAMVTVLLMMLAMGFGATAFGKRFRTYTIVTMVMLAGFGVLTGLDSPRMAANLPTPLIGIWERINIGAFILWVMVLAVVLLRDRTGRDGGASSRRAGV